MTDYHHYTCHFLCTRDECRGVHYVLPLSVCPSVTFKKACIIHVFFCFVFYLFILLHVWFIHLYLSFFHFLHVYWKKTRDIYGRKRKNSDQSSEHLLVDSEAGQSDWQIAGLSSHVSMQDDSIGFLHQHRISIENGRSWMTAKGNLSECVGIFCCNWLCIWITNAALIRACELFMFVCISKAQCYRY